MGGVRWMEITSMKPKRPNILLIMSDQHHAGVMGCAGDAIAETPNIIGT
jgi:choline-sulfatase